MTLPLKKVFIFTWKMRNVLKRMKNQFLRLSVFEIWSMLYSKSAHFQLIFSTISTITQKLKIGKSIFHLLQHIPHLSCKFDHFWTIFSFWSVTHLKSLTCLCKIVNIISHNSKNKNKKIDFPFDSALCASIIKIGLLLKLEGNGGGRLHILCSEFTDPSMRTTLYCQYRLQSFVS